MITLKLHIKSLSNMQSLQYFSLRAIVQDNARLYAHTSLSNHTYSQIFYSQIDSLFIKELIQIASESPNMVYKSCNQYADIEDFIYKAMPYLIQAQCVDLNDPDFPEYLINKTNVLVYLQTIQHQYKLLKITKLASNIMDSEIAEMIAKISTQFNPKELDITDLAKYIGKYLTESSTIQIIHKSPNCFLDKLIPNINIESSSVADALITTSCETIIYKIIPCIIKYLDDELVLKCAQKLKATSMLVQILKKHHYNINSNLQTRLFNYCGDYEVVTFSNYLPPFDKEMTCQYILKCNNYNIPKLAKILFSLANSKTDNFSKIKEQLVCLERAPSVPGPKGGRGTSEEGNSEACITSSEGSKLDYFLNCNQVLDNEILELLVEKCENNSIHSLVISLASYLVPLNKIIYPELLEKIIEKSANSMYVVAIASFTKPYLLHKHIYKLIDACSPYEICDLALHLRDLLNLEMKQHLLQKCIPSQLNKLKFILDSFVA